MLATGIRSPLGIQVAGTDLATIDRFAGQIEAAVKNVPGVSSALAERLTGGRFIDIDVDRLAAAGVSVEEGPPMLRSENARLSGGVDVNVLGRDLRSVVHDMQAAVARQVAMSAVPFSLIGGFWLVWALGHAVSVATAVGFIALAGVAVEFGVVMLVYLNYALKRRLKAGEADDEATLLAAIREGAVLRVRPKAMTVAVAMAGLLPILSGGVTGSEVMSRIAAPMVGAW